MTTATTQAVTENRVEVRIPSTMVDALSERFAHLNRRAARLGISPMQVVFTPSDFRRLQLLDRDSLTYSWAEESRAITLASKPDYELTGLVQTFVDVVIVGRSPIIAGWEFVGRLTPITDDNGHTSNLLMLAPGQSCPEEFRAAVAVCQHCHTNRRRSETFVVRNVETNQYKSVGRNCLRDFLGHASPEAIVAQLTWLAEVGYTIDELSHEQSWGGSCRSVALHHFLTLVSAIVKIGGWRSRTVAREHGGVATADAAWCLLFPTNPSYARAEIEALNISDAHRAEATAAIDWASSLEDATDYLGNIRAVASTSTIDSKLCGLAASIIVAYQKHLGRLAEARRFAESQHVGQVGQRLTLAVECLSIHRCETQYGTTGIHRLMTDDGNILTWFASGSTSWLEVGEKATVKATVKGHDAYKGVKQTIVTRVTVQ